MLRHTFCHTQGVGPKTERRLWAGGIHTWDHACDPDALPVQPARAHAIVRTAEESIRRLDPGDAAWFYGKLPSREQWRLFSEFRGSTAYLDIETTGLGGPYDYITTIALYDGATVRHYVHDENMDDFPRDVEDYALLVTYNGKQFDVPFIRDHLGAPMRHAHVDLCFVLRSLGYKGGLKGCERQLGIERDGLDGVDGFFAVLLWREWLKQPRPAGARHAAGLQHRRYGEPGDADGDGLQHEGAAGGAAGTAGTAPPRRAPRPLPRGRGDRHPRAPRPRMEPLCLSRPSSACPPDAATAPSPRTSRSTRTSAATS